MNWTFTPFAVPLFFGGALVLALAIGVLWRRRTPGAVPLAVLSVAVAVYVIGYGLEIGSPTLADVRLWLKVEYLGVATLPGLTLLVALDYTGNRRWLSPINVAAVLAIPAITCILVWTNELHQWMWPTISVSHSGGLTLTVLGRGPWYVVHGGYTVAAIAASVVVLTGAMIQASTLYRRQLAVILAAILLPVLVNLVYLSGLVIPGLDLNPYGEIIALGLLAWGMFNYRIFDLAPVAQEAVLRSMSDALLIFDTRNRLVRLNPAAEQLVSNPSQSIGKDFAMILPASPDLLSGEHAKHGSHLELPLAADGERRIFHVTTTHVVSQPGKSEGHAVVLRDVTAQVQAQLALEQANQRLETLRAFDADLNRNLDPRHVASVAIEAAVRLSGADAAALVDVGAEGHRVLQARGGYAPAMAGQLIETERGIMHRVIRTHEPDYTPDVLDDPDYLALIATTRAQITLPLLSGEKLLGVLLLEAAQPEKFTEDVFEALKLLAARTAVALDNAAIYQERDHLAKELDTFAQTVAHNLKSPIGIIQGYADMLSSLDLDKEAKLYAESILADSRKAGEIIEALLTLARAGALEESKIAEVDMGDVARTVLSRLGPVIEQSGAQVSAPDRWPKVRGYGPWIEEVWMNYVANAVKYGGKPPLVELGWDEQPDHYLRFWVRDNGRGLRPTEAAQLFRPFVRLDRDHAEGHGLGLSIVQRITERLGGKVGVETAVGKGSRFYFTLPPARQAKKRRRIADRQ